MSETQNETQTPPQAEAQSSEQTIPLKLVKRETGQTHYVDGGSRVDLVRHAETGEPEQEYALLATIDGVDVKLSSWNAGPIDVRARAAKQTQQAQQQTAV